VQVTTHQSTPIETPAWLAEANLDGDLIDGLPNKREGDRTNSALYRPTERDDHCGETLSAQVYNVSPHGMGMIIRRLPTPGQCKQLTPGCDSCGALLHAVVVHRTKLFADYKVGCHFQLC